MTCKNMDYTFYRIYLLGENEKKNEGKKCDKRVQFTSANNINEQAKINMLWQEQQQQQHTLRKHRIQQMLADVMGIVHHRAAIGNAATAAAAFLFKCGHFFRC